MNTPRTPPRFVPTLTEVVEFQEAQVLDDTAPVVLDLDTDAPRTMPLARPAVEAITSTVTSTIAPARPPADAQATAPVASLAPASPPTSAPPSTPTLTPTSAAPVPAPASTPASTPTIVSPTLVADDVPAFLLAASAASPVAAEPAAAAEVLSHEREEQIVQAVLTELQRRTDLMLEYRLRETLAPSLARLTDALIKEVRHDLAATLRDVVARAVAQELTRHRPK